MNRKFKYITLGFSITIVFIILGLYLLNYSKSSDTTNEDNVTVSTADNTTDNQNNVTIPTADNTTDNQNNNSNSSHISNTIGNNTTNTQNENKDKAIEISENTNTPSSWNGGFYLKNGDGKLSTIQQDPSSLKFTIYGKNDGDFNFLNNIEGTAKISDNIATYKNPDGSTITFQNNNGSFHVTEYDKNNTIIFEGAYLQD